MKATCDPRGVGATVGTLLLLGVVAGAGACGEVNGGESPLAGTTEIKASSGAYRFHCLSPPWVPVRVSGDLVDMIVPAPGATVAMPAARVSLHVEPRPELSTEGATSEGRTMGATPRPIFGLDGREIGSEVAGVRDGVFTRQGHLTAPGGSYRMTFAADSDMADEPLVTLLMRSFELLSRAPGSGERQ